MSTSQTSTSQPKTEHIPVEEGVKLSDAEKRYLSDPQTDKDARRKHGGSDRTASKPSNKAKAEAEEGGPDIPSLPEVPTTAATR